LLSVATTYAQVDDLSYRFIKVHQEKVHDQMMDGVAGNPWQYRILADWMIEQVIQLTYRTGVRVALVACAAGSGFYPGGVVWNHRENKSADRFLI